MRRIRPLAVPTLTATLGALLGLGLSSTVARPAIAQTVPSNPWVFTETNPAAEGLRINAAAGANGQPFVVYDYLNQPIGGFNRAGGFWVAGDNISVSPGNDIYHAQTTISPDDPNPAVCVRAGQLWIGGTEGGFWRCADLDGSGPSPLAWWPA